jgi:hypothetical protein
MKLLAALTALTSATLSAAPVSISYSARIENVSGNQGLVNDFLNVFHLHTIDGPTGTEIPFSGTYTFDFPQPDQAPATDRLGLYVLSGFTINGVPLSFAAGDPLLNRIELQICGPCALVTDYYIVGAFNAVVTPSDGLPRTVQIGLELDLPGGTLTDVLAPNVDFFPLATGVRYGSSAVSYMDTSLGGPTVWESASTVSAVPEPASFVYTAALFNVLICLRRRCSR